MDTEQVAQPELRIQAVLDFKKELEKSRWNKKWILKFVEASAFMGMFLFTNPIGFQISVVVAAIALLMDVYLAYDEWHHEWSFKQMTY